MASFSSRVLYLAALGTCAVAAVRPHGLVERGLELALSPLRALSEVAAPVGLLRARAVRAAERRVAQLSAVELRERSELGADQRRFVLPRDPALRAQRGFVIAEVVGRPRDDADRLVVRVLGGGGEDAPPALAAGMPVVVGDRYVGRVHDVAPDGARATLDLVTRRDVFVGARLEAQPPAGRPARAVVGGLARNGRAPGELLLAVRTPSAPLEGEGARVVVDESLAGHAAFAGLADGFELGRLVGLGERREERAWGVRSSVDFRSGVFQVAIVTPDSGGGDARRAAEEQDVLEDGRWVRARALSCGDPDGLREGVKLDAGSTRDVGPGAALVAGARCVGRVESVGLFGADARLLGDPGLALPAVARVEGREQPLILGTLVGLGRGARDGERARVRLHWEEGWPGAAPDAPDEPVPARLFTGAGAAGVPPGLVLGDAWLPRRGGPVEIELALEVDPRELRHLRVRRGAPAARTPSGGAP